ncbi:MAG: hypothetical protein ACK5O3_11720 [Burkholderiales bacterium]
MTASTLVVAIVGFLQWALLPFVIRISMWMVRRIMKRELLLVEIGFYLAVLPAWLLLPLELSGNLPIGGNGFVYFLASAAGGLLSSAVKR